MGNIEISDELIENFEKNYEYCYLQSMHNLAKEIQPELLFTGLSYGVTGIETTKLHKRALNLCMHSQDLYYDSLHIQKLGEVLDGVESCIFMLGYYSLFYDLSMSSSNYKCIKTYLPLFGDIHHYDNGIAAQAKKTGKKIQELKTELPYFTPDVLEFSDGIFRQEPLFYGNKFTREKMRTGKELWCQENEEDKTILAQALAMKHNKFIKYIDTYMENTKLFVNIIKNLQEKGIRTYIVFTPFSPEYIKYIIKDYKMVMVDLLNNLNEIVHIIDMNDLDIFLPEDFLDADHVNLQGAIKVTKILDEIL